MTSLTDQLVEAIVRAKADLTSLLKDQAREANGEFASGSGNGGPPTGSAIERDAKSLPADTRATADRAKATGSAQTLVPKEVGDRMATHYQLTGEHEDAATLHQQLAGYAERAGNKELAAAHRTAADLHDRAATLHSYAVRDLKNASGRATDGFGGANYTGRAAAAAAASNDAATATVMADRIGAKAAKSLQEQPMDIDADVMTEAIAKARQDLAPLLKEQERDENGRFAGSGGSSSGGEKSAESQASDKLADRASSLNPRSGASSFGLMADQHGSIADKLDAAGKHDAAEVHRNVSGDWTTLSEQSAVQGVGRLKSDDPQFTAFKESLASAAAGSKLAAKITAESN